MTPSLPPNERPGDDEAVAEELAGGLAYVPERGVGQPGVLHVGVGPSADAIMQGVKIVLARHLGERRGATGVGAPRERAYVAHEVRLRADFASEFVGPRPDGAGVAVMGQVVQPLQFLREVVAVARRARGGPMSVTATVRIVNTLLSIPEGYLNWIPTS